MSLVTSGMASVLRRCAAAAVFVAGVAFAGSSHAECVLNGQTIRLIVVSDPVFKVMQQIHDNLEKMACGKIELTVLPFDNLHQQVLLNSQNTESRYDIVAVDLPQFGEYKSFLLDLTPWASSFDKSDFQTAAWDGVVHDGKILAIPIQPHPEIFAYRTDLFKAAGIANPPKTIDDVLEDAKKLNNPAKNVAAICWNAARGTPLGQTFLQTLGAFGQAPIDLTKNGDDYDIGTIKPKNMRPTIDNKAGVAVANYLKALMPYSPPGILDMAWDERTRVFAQGGCAMTYVWSGNASAWDGDPKSPAYGNVAYVPHPAGIGAPNRSTLGGWSLAIPTNLPKERQELAWKVIQWLTTKEMMVEYTKNGDCVSPRHSVSQDPDVVKRCPAVKAVDDFASAGEIASWQRPPVPELQQMVDVLGTQMHEMISGGKSPEDAVKEAQRLIDRIMRKAGYYQ
ncbi:MAG: sugar ABC transporter substrate-binding protein [Methylobacteriaceae bacterium]|nr:sugar ABC transporter substrate-binding protein [Methylobacteriaceae bacterium]